MDKLEALDQRGGVRRSTAHNPEPASDQSAEHHSWVELDPGEREEADRIRYAQVV